MNKTLNQLKNETSPYLLQHAGNPVDWHPWNEATLALAKQSGKPILLSVGYSACHWCHVMAREAFSDGDTAALMNELFINIKVDREERPDLDKIYQTSLQLISERTSGGWPLTMFLTPDKQLPFYGGTYFPLSPSHGLPAFKDVLKQVAGFYEAQKNQNIKQFSERIGHALTMLTATGAAPDEMNEKLLLLSVDGLMQEYDSVHGGFSPAPKFPQPLILEALMRHAAGEKSSGSVAKALKHSLTAMALGGLYDQVGGGFFRYCVDAQWAIPHFEKMLYDNAQLLQIYSNAAVMFDDALLKQTALQTGEWLMSEMQSDECGYYTSFNADSEGVEGKYYVWDKIEIQNHLNSEEFSLLKKYFGLTEQPNFEGVWHLNVVKSISEIADETKMTKNDLDVMLQDALQKLLRQRSLRVAPSRDEKVLTSWNALTIKAMLLAGVRLGRDDFITSARKSLAFVYSNLFKEGRLLASYKDQQAKGMAFLDDCAFTLDALMTYLQVEWDSEMLKFAISLADSLLSFFYDATEGGFFFTASDQELLIQRPKMFMDEVMPSGNGVAALSLLRLGYLLGEERYINAAEKTIHAAYSAMEKMPPAFNSLLHAMRVFLNPESIVIVRGEVDELKAVTQTFFQRYVPDRLCFAIPNDVIDLPAALALKKPKNQLTTYVCRGFECEQPV